MKYLPLLCLLFCLPGCVSYQYYPREEKLTQLPTPPHQDPVEIFFLGESRPQEPYVRVAVFKTSSYDQQNMTHLVKNLQRKAQESGCDAVVVTSQDSFEEVRTAGMGDVADTYSVAGQSMIAIGIKYVDDLPEGQAYLCGQKVWEKGQNGWIEAGSAQFQSDGRPVSFEGRAKTSYRYSLDYLLNATDGWEFSQALYGSYPPTPPTLTRRRQTNGYTTDLVRVDYRRDSLPKSIRLVTLGRRPVNATMALVYNQQLQVIRRSWKENQRTVRTDISYDTQGRKETEIFYWDLPEEENAFRRVEYEYCEVGNWEEILKDEQVIRPGEQGAGSRK